MQANWIAGTWRRAESGFVFRPPAAADDRFAHPRSSAIDATLALDALVRAESAWRACSEHHRRAVLVRLAEAIARAPDPGGAFAELLGWTDEEARNASERLEDELVGSVREGPRTVLRGAFTARAGIVLVRCDWSELVTGVAREVLALLGLGRGVLLLSDPAAPMVAEAVVRACVDSGVEVPLALLHEDGNAVLQHALRDARLSGLAVSAPSARMREIERWLNDAARATHRSSGFGAGIDEPPVPERELRVLRNQSRIVRRNADVEAAAGELVLDAFGRARALSGQAPGAVGRVFCHERVFSSFTKALLQELARSEDVERPLATLDPGLQLHHRRAIELGLDEGATPIFSASDRSAEGGSPPKAHRLAPAVFTNVEEHQRLAWLGRPAPLLCLGRFGDDARAEELATALDRDPLAEDLSGESLGGNENSAVDFLAQAAGASRPMRGTPLVHDDENEELELHP